MKIKTLKIAMALLGAALVSGCSYYYQSRTDAEFGNAVRAATEGQIYDLNAALNPDPNAVLGGDPDRLDNILDVHREDISKPAEESGPITINLGGQ